MAISEAISRSVSEAASPSAGGTASTADDAASPSGSKTTAVVLAMLLTLAAAGAWGYTQWWVPREEAQQVAKVQYAQCLEEVKVYKGKKSYKTRLAQCSKFLSD